MYLLYLFNLLIIFIDYIYYIYLLDLLDLFIRFIYYIRRFLLNKGKKQKINENKEQYFFQELILINTNEGGG